MITRTGANAGAACLVRELPSTHYVSSHTLRVLPNQKDVEPEYLETFLLSRWGKAQIQKRFTGAAQKQLQIASVSTIVVPVPPLPVPRELVAEMQAARERRAERLCDAEQELAGIDAFLLDALGLTLPPPDTCTIYAVRLKDVLAAQHGGRCDVDYYAPRYALLERALVVCPHPKAALGDLSPELAGGAMPTRGDEELYADDGIKFLRILNVKPNEIDLADVKYIAPDVHEMSLFRSQLQMDDVLMTITGRVGTAAVVPHDILPANINQHIVRLRLQTADCLPEYLAAYLNSSLGNALTNRGVSGGTRIAVDYGAVRKIQVPVPPREIQERIISEIQQRKAAVRTLHEEAAREWEDAKARFERRLLGEGA